MNIRHNEPEEASVSRLASNQQGIEMVAERLWRFVSPKRNKIPIFIQDLDSAAPKLTLTQFSFLSSGIYIT